MGRTITVEGPSGLNGVDDSDGRFNQSPGVGPKIEEDVGKWEKGSYTTSHPDSVEEPEGEGASDDDGSRNNHHEITNHNQSTEQTMMRRESRVA